MPVLLEVCSLGVNERSEVSNVDRFFVCRGILYVEEYNWVDFSQKVIRNFA